MPVDWSRYPPEWPAIRARILARAGDRCEWCGVRNGAVGARDRYGHWHDADAIEQMNSTLGMELFGEFPDVVRIVLTVAHLGVPYPDGRPGDKHDKRDVRDENLAALCQRCHLSYDRADHLRRAAEARRRRRIEAGQLVLWEGAA